MPAYSGVSIACITLTAARSRVALKTVRDKLHKEHGNLALHARRMCVALTFAPPWVNNLRHRLHASVGLLEMVGSWRDAALCTVFADAYL